MGHHSKDPESKRESKHDRHDRSSRHGKDNGKEKERDKEKEKRRKKKKEREREKDRKRSPSPKYITNHERRKQDIHFGIEPFIKTLFGSKDAKKRGEKESRARHKAWAELDRRRAERILSTPSHKSSKKKQPQEPEAEPEDEAPEAPGEEIENDEPESDNEAN